MISFRFTVHPFQEMHLYSACGQTTGMVCEERSEYPFITTYYWSLNNIAAEPVKQKLIATLPSYTPRHYHLQWVAVWSYAWPYYTWLTYEDLLTQWLFARVNEDLDYYWGGSPDFSMLHYWREAQRAKACFSSVMVFYHFYLLGSKIASATINLLLTIFHAILMPILVFPYLACPRLDYCEILFLGQLLLREWVDLQDQSVIYQWSRDTDEGGRNVHGWTFEDTACPYALRQSLRPSPRFYISEIIENGSWSASSETWGILP